jgi:hypothetical protein
MEGGVDVEKENERTRLVKERTTKIIRRGQIVTLSRMMDTPGICIIGKGKDRTRTINFYWRIGGLFSNWIAFIAAVESSAKVPNCIPGLDTRSRYVVR